MGRVKDCRVLIVEDERLSAHSLEKILKGMNYKVTGIAASGEKAIELASQSSPDIILMDIHLEGKLDGIQAAERIHHLWNIPVIFMTASSDEETTQRAILTNPFGYLLKPFNPAELRILIEMSLYKNRLDRELAESENRYRSLFEANKNIMLIIDPADGRIVDANPSACSFYGYDRSSLTSLSMYSISARDREAVQASMELARGESSRAFFFQHRLSNGEIRHVEVNSTPITLDGKALLHAIIHDISDRVHAEDKVRQQERLLHSVINAAPTGIGLLVDRHFIWTNEYLSTLVGYSAEEMRGQSARMLYENEDEFLRVGREKYPQIRQSGRGSIETRFQHKDGRLIDVLLSSQAIDPQDLSAGVIFTALDISGQKRAYEALQQSKRTLFTLMSNLPGMAYRCRNDPDWTMEFVSEGCLELTGYPDEDLLENRRFSFGSIIHPDDRRQVWDNIQLALEKKTPYHLTYRIATASGSQKWVWEKGQGVFDAQGNLLHLEGFITDITQRVEAENDLRESESRFRQLAESVKEVFWLRDRSSGQVLYVSPAYESVWQRPVQELYSNPGFYTSSIYSDDLERYQEKLADLELNSQPFDVEYRIIWPDNSLRWIRERAYPVLDAQGNVFRYAGIAEDITENKLAQFQQEAILAISTALRQVGTRNEMLPIILESLQQLLGLSCAAIGSVDTSSGEISIEKALGGTTQFGGLLSASIADLAESAFASGLVQLRSASGCNPLDELNQLYSIPDSLAVAPLIAAKERVGVLVIGRQLPFTEAEIRVLISAAEIAANAIHRATSHEQTRRSLRQLEALHRIDEAITATTRLENILGVFLDQLMDQLRVDAAAVFLYEAPTQMLLFKVGLGFRTKVVQGTSLRLGEKLTGRVALERRLFFVPDIREHVQGSDELFFPWEPEGFTSYVGAPIISHNHILGVLEIYQRSPLDPPAEWFSFLRTLERQVALAIDNASMFDDLQRSNQELMLAYDTTLEGWAKTLELRDHETEGHSRRVTEAALSLARAVGMHDSELIHVRRGALLHDIGKIGIPDSILNKPGPLDEAEWAVMRQHPTFAFNLLAGIPYLRQALDIPYCHHEKWDGSGYPRNLKGEQIPLAARIFAVIDVYDALVHDRPYRPAWSKEKALAYIQEQSGSHFDPHIVEAFQALIRQQG